MTNETKTMAVRAFFERLARPGTGTCFRCRRPWGRVKEHDVTYWQSLDGSCASGAFALCESCWVNSSDIERWSAMYRRHGHRHSDWDLIDAALRKLSEVTRLRHNDLRGPRLDTSSEAGSLPDTQEGRDGGHA